MNLKNLITLKGDKKSNDIEKLDFGKTLLIR